MIWLRRAFFLLLPAFTHALSPCASSQLACDTLQSILGQPIVQTPHTNETQYQEGIDHAWSAFNSEYYPSCIVFPESTEDVELTMSVIYSHDVDYSVQSGGHSAMTGWNNVDHGVLILFSNMKNISYDPIKDSIVIQPGLSWGEAIEALHSQGVAPMGGRVSSVGTGLLLGGGFSFLSPSHGFSSDGFISLEVVLVNGTVVTATANNQYSDLFHALKGGANRFGIVTQYEVEAIHTGTKDDKTWFGGTLSYNESDAEAVVKALAHFVRDVKDPNASILSYFASLSMNGTLMLIPLITLFYNGTQLPTDVFGELLSIPSTGTLQPASYYDAANALVSTDVIRTGQLFGASALQTDEDTYLNALSSFRNFSQTFKDQYTSSILAFTPVLDSWILASRSKGGNPMNPPLGGYNAVQFHLTFPEGVKKVSKDLEDGRQLFLKQVPPANGIPLYVNECDAKQNVFETYSEYDLLKQTYAKYDPTRFNIRHTAGPIGL